MDGWRTSLLGVTVKPGKDGYHTVRNKSEPRVFAVQQSMFIGSLIPFKYCLSYIDHIQSNSISTLPSALVLIRESTIP